MSQNVSEKTVYLSTAAGISCDVGIGFFGFVEFVGFIEFFGFVEVVGFFGFFGFLRACAL